MFKQLLTLEWKSFFRSAGKGQDLAMKIFMGFLAVYFGLSYLFIGIGLYPIISKLVPGTPPIHIVNSYAALWVLLEFFIRYMMQKLPVMNVRPLLTQNIRKKTIVHYVLIKSSLSFFNVLAALLFIPFGIWSVVVGDISAIQLLCWWLALLSLVMIINFLNLYLNKKFADNIKQLIPFFILLIGLCVLEYLAIFKTTVYFGQVLDFLLLHPYLVVIPVASAGSMYFLNLHFLKNNLHLDSGTFKKRAVTAGSADLSWTRRFGSIAPFLQNDIRLIWRNKRPKSAAIMSFLFVAYGLIFFMLDQQQAFFMVFLGIFMTGMFSINFGQFIPAWDSSYYPMMMTQNIPMKQYLYAKAGLMYFSIVLLAILTTPYVYFGTDVLFTFLASAMYNAGVNVPLILFAGSFNKKRIDMEKSQYMNYQGTGAAQWVISIPLLIIPIGIWGVTAFVFNTTAASIVLAVIGITGLLLRNVFMEEIVRAYKKRKYIMIQGFKQVT